MSLIGTETVITIGVYRKGNYNFSSRFAFLSAGQMLYRNLLIACFICYQGKVKQIVGSTLRDSKEDGTKLVTNFESDMSAAEYADLYKKDGLTGGHVIMLGADPLSQAAAIEALHVYPGILISIIHYFRKLKFVVCFEFFRVS